MSTLSKRLQILEVANKPDQATLFLILRAGSLESEVTGIGQFSRLQGESMEELKARAMAQHRVGVLMLFANYEGDD